MIRVLFFGMLATKTGTREAELELKKQGATVSDVLDEVRRRFDGFPDGPLLFAVNEEQADLSSPVKDGDEVAIMPPFSGG